MAGNGLALWQGARRQKGRGTESVGRLPQSAPPPPGRPADWHGHGLLLGALSPFLGVLYHQGSLQAVLGPVYFGRQRSGNSCCGPVRFEHRLVNGLLECVAMTMPHLGVASGLSAGLGSRGQVLACGWVGGGGRLDGERQPQPGRGRRARSFVRQLQFSGELLAGTGNPRICVCVCV